MDKIIHKKLNIIEASCVLIGIACLLVSATLHFGETIKFYAFYQDVLGLIGILLEAVVVSIELMLFHLENKQYKFMTIGYYLLELVCIMFSNAAIPFMGLLVLTIFVIAKNIYRILNVEVIYKTLGYYELCKKFGIKVKKPRKARTTVTRKKTVTARTPKRAASQEEPTYA